MTRQGVAAVPELHGVTASRKGPRRRKLAQGRPAHSPSAAMSKIILEAREDLPSYLVMGSLVLCAFLV